ncbi:MAG: endonuclease [Chitinophagales bacterium]
MPEGPSIVILKEAVASFKNRKIVSVEGTQKAMFRIVEEAKVTDFKTWGKHFLICFQKETIKVHFLLFGSYTINERKVNREPKLRLKFPNGEISFYACQITLLNEKPREIYDWSSDILSEDWNEKTAHEKVRAQGKKLICDVLVDQEIFAGSGNIIKNEVLFICRLHPETEAQNLSAAQSLKLVRTVRKYAFQFLNWKKNGVFMKHCKVYKQKNCSVCGKPITVKVTGKSKRKSYFCHHDQKK